ncbi:oxidoreductase [Mycobacterium haemophilum]|uniref:Oxidoreductase n=2 Tax=Mycobacterium haemophilum TaxID=29311 RepID=A0A0I9UFP0_9MYCO|nr:oxidoreductase [Mycobacterium haemophilum]KLO35399.1 oxidoreductase [Mycobacterium haemophilum]KLO40588.1 oxidoreductase [Mycobacterium haemophilum]KLO48006.1 oxidoreductase [Mycobacterium haemophilum]
MMYTMISVRNITALPVVDLRANSGPLRISLREAAHGVGFCYLTGHHVPDVLVGSVLEVAHRLFELPQADKDAIAMVRSPHFRGYTRLGGELTGGEVDWREQIDIGPELPPIGGLGKPDYLWLQGLNQWPAALPELPGIIGEWDTALSGVARTLLGHWAASLGSPPDVFDPAFAGTPATLIKMIRYPARAATAQGVGAHRDAGVLTLLLAEPGSQGLQVRRYCGHGGDRAENSDWIDVEPLDGAFVVNIGELLEVATGGYFRATEHRVNLYGPAADRISVPYFFNPRLDAQIPMLSLPEELGALVDERDDPSDPIFSVYGRNAWKSRLRAHPDVAAAHGYSPGRVECEK